MGCASEAASAPLQGSRREIVGTLVAGDKREGAAFSTSSWNGKCMDVGPGFTVMYYLRAALPRIFVVLNLLSPLLFFCSRQWPYSLFKRVSLGIARGMSYLHNCSPPILHRDLKSANVLLDEYYNPKICDFGLARFQEPSNQNGPMTGQTGTCQWMAREVLANEPYGEEADIYSFGVIMWELLTRECPFEGLSQIQVALKTLKGEQLKVPPWIRCSPHVCSTIEACLSSDKSKRPTLQQLIHQLEQ